eukprot:3142847-Alexandrium_andersonii.AAC.1
MVLAGGAVLCALVQSTPVLRDQVMSDLRALHKHSPKLELLPSPVWTPSRGSCLCATTLRSGRRSWHVLHPATMPKCARTIPSQPR